MAGGMTELLYIDASTIMVSDKHRHIINLASVVATDGPRRQLIGCLNDLLFHPDTLHFAQQKCLEMERAGWDFGKLETRPDVQWAVNFFICAWMGRNGKAGTDTEFSGGTSVRFVAGGGDSCIRFRSAARCLVGWRSVLRRCTFHTLDCFEFLDKCKDQPEIGLYCDPPFPGPGDDYRHKFTVEQHARLAEKLGVFKKTRVVCRFYDDPLVRKLYSPDRWTWRRLAGGRDQKNAEKPEVLLIRNGREPASGDDLFT